MRFFLACVWFVSCTAFSSDVVVIDKPVVLESTILAKFPAEFRSTVDFKGLVSFSKTPVFKRCSVESTAKIVLDGECPILSVKLVSDPVIKVSLEDGQKTLLIVDNDDKVQRSISFLGILFWEKSKPAVKLRAGAVRMFELMRIDDKYFIKVTGEF